MLSSLLAVVVIGACRQDQDPVQPRITPHAAARFAFTDPGQVIGLNIHVEDHIGAVAQDLGVNIVRTEIDFWHPDTAANYVQTTLAGAGSQIQVYAHVAYGYEYAFASTRFPDSSAYSHCGAHSDFNDKTCIPDGTPSPADGDAWDGFLAHWKRFVHAVVTAQETHITYWGAWNEPNPTDTSTGAGSFFHGHTWQYDSLARALCDTVHAISTRDAVVIGHPLTCVGPEAGLRTSRAPIATADSVAVYDIPWIQGRLAAANFDIVSVHLYAPVDTVFANAGRVKNVIGTRPLWVTEVGHVAPDVAWQANDPELQDKGVYDLIHRFWQQSAVSALFFYDVHSMNDGLEDFNTQKRPAYNALKLLTATPATATPAPGYCTGVAGPPFTPTYCNLAANPADGYTGEIDAQVIDNAGQWISTVGVVGYLGRGSVGYPFGTKVTDGAGAARFRVRVIDQVTGVTEQNGLAISSLPSGYTLAYGQPYYADGITTTPGSLQRRYFVVSHDTQCRLNAVFYLYGSDYPISGLGASFYTGPGGSVVLNDTMRSDEDGIVSLDVNCAGGGPNNAYGYGISTGTSLMKPHYCLQSGDGNYAYFDGISWPVTPNGASWPTIPSTSVFRYFYVVPC